MWAVLLSWIPSIIRSILAALGIGVVSYLGMDLFINTVVTSIQANMNNLATDVLQILKMYGIDQAISIQISAVIARITLSSFGIGFRRA